MTPRREGPGIFLGILMLLGLHLAAILLTYGLTYLINSPVLLLASVFGIGITQILYVAPAMIWAANRRYWGVFKGLLGGAVLTALLNGGCFLILFGPR